MDPISFRDFENDARESLKRYGIWRRCQRTTEKIGDPDTMSKSPEKLEDLDTMPESYRNDRGSRHDVGELSKK